MLDWWEEVRRWIRKTSVDRKGTWWQLLKIICRCCLCRIGNRSRKILESGCRACYLVCTESMFEPLHNIHLGTSKKLKETILAYSSFWTICTNLDHTSGEQKRIIPLQSDVLRGFVGYLTGNEKNDGGNALRKDFPRGDTSSAFNGLFTTTDLRGCWSKKTIGNLT